MGEDGALKCLIVCDSLFFQYIRSLCCLATSPAEFPGSRLFWLGVQGPGQIVWVLSREMEDVGVNVLSLRRI